MRTTEEAEDGVIDVLRAARRFVTPSGGLRSWHGFSTGHHYDPANTSFGRLVACDEHLVDPGAGFPPHPHRELDIITWVVDGALEHSDDGERRSLLTPGCAAVTRAGTGVVHAEVNARPGPLRFVQMWLLPVDPCAVPSYEQADVGAALEAGEPVRVAGAGGPLPLPGAVLWAARLSPGRTWSLPEAPYVVVHVVRGSADLDGAGRLEAGDSVRLTNPTGHRITGGPAELLVLEQA